MSAPELREHSARSSLFESLRNEHSPVPVILITGHADAPAVIRKGLLDFLIRPFEPELLAAVNRAVNGEALDEAKLARGFDLLTDREGVHILESVVAGEFSRAIADRLGFSTKTVEAHRARINAKTQADNVSHLVRMWRAWNTLTS